MGLEGWVVVLKTDIRKQYLCHRNSTYEGQAHDRVGVFEKMHSSAQMKLIDK